jgi:hypothetical protein
MGPLALALALLVGPIAAGATTPPAGFVLVETIQVPSTNATVSSTTVLQSGVTYKIRVSGVITVAGPPGPQPCPFADGEYERFDAAGADSCGLLADLAFGTTDTGVSIDDGDLDGAKSPKWGPYDPSHEYTTDFLGKGAPISLRYHDAPTWYFDNSGSLTVEIFAPGQAVPTLTEWARILLVSLLLGGALWVMRRQSRAARPAA